MAGPALVNLLGRCIIAVLLISTVRPSGWSAEPDLERADLHSSAERQAGMQALLGALRRPGLTPAQRRQAILDLPVEEVCAALAVPPDQNLLAVIDLLRDGVLATVVHVHDDRLTRQFCSLALNVVVAQDGLLRAGLMDRPAWLSATVAVCRDISDWSVAVERPPRPAVLPRTVMDEWQEIDFAVAGNGIAVDDYLAAVHGRLVDLVQPSPLPDLQQAERRLLQRLVWHLTVEGRVRNWWVEATAAERQRLGEACAAGPLREHLPVEARGQLGPASVAVAEAVAAEPSPTEPDALRRRLVGVRLDRILAAALPQPPSAEQLARLARARDTTWQVASCWSVSWLDQRLAASDGLDVANTRAFFSEPQALADLHRQLAIVHEAYTEFPGRIAIALAAAGCPPQRQEAIMLHLTSGLAHQRTVQLAIADSPLLWRMLAWKAARAHPLDAVRGGAPPALRPDPPEVEVDPDMAGLTWAERIVARHRLLLDPAVAPSTAALVLGLQADVMIMSPIN